MCANVWMHTHAQACPFCLRCTRLFAGTQTRHEYLKGFSLHALHICHHQSLKSLLEGRGPCEEHMCVRVCVCGRLKVAIFIYHVAPPCQEHCFCQVCVMSTHKTSPHFTHSSVCVCLSQNEEGKEKEQGRENIMCICCV